jgi:hypothetical protein
VRQFVATRLVQGESAEEQITGSAEFGGLQLIAIPMRADVYHRMFEKKIVKCHMNVCFEQSEPPFMGFMAGGKINQTIEEDPYGIGV